jgi:hypothetical protein
MSAVGSQGCAERIARDLSPGAGASAHPAFTYIEHGKPKSDMSYQTPEYSDFIVTNVVAALVAIAGLIFSWIGLIFVISDVFPSIHTFEGAGRHWMAAALCLGSVAVYVVFCTATSKVNYDETVDPHAGAFSRLAKGQPAMMVSPGLVHVSDGYHSLTLPDGLRKIDAATDGVHFTPFSRLTQKDAQLAGYEDISALHDALQAANPSFSGMSVVTLCKWVPQSAPYAP